MVADFFSCAISFILKITTDFLMDHPIISDNDEEESVSCVGGDLGSCIYHQRERFGIKRCNCIEDPYRF